MKICKKIAVIGGGISGLTAAYFLKEKFSVEIFEKAKSVGGRMSVKYHDNYQFDIGAQHFSAKNKIFKDFLKKPLDLGIVKYWSANFCEIDKNNIISKRFWNEEFMHLVGSDKMNSLCKYIANDLNIRLQTCITKISKENNKWTIIDSNNNKYENFDYLIIAIPSQQLINLEAQLFVDEDLSQYKMLGCYVIILGLKRKIDLNFDAALIKNSLISWISIDSTKPGRPGGFSIVANSSNLWAEENIEASIDFIREKLLHELKMIINFDEKDIDYINTHKWRYANTKYKKKPVRGGKDEISNIYSEKNSLGICGDWFIQARVESAFLSGYDLSQKIINISK